LKRRYQSNVPLQSELRPPAVVRKWSPVAGPFEDGVVAAYEKHDCEKLMRLLKPLAEEAKRWLRSTSAGYERGKPVPADFRARLYVEAAAQGDAMAQMNLASMYR
jgi:hypothetical protein